MSKCDTQKLAPICIEELLWALWLCLILHSACQGCKCIVRLYKLVLWTLGIDQTDWFRKLLSWLAGKDHQERKQHARGKMPVLGGPPVLGILNFYQIGLTHIHKQYQLNSMQKANSANVQFIELQFSTLVYKVPFSAPPFIGKLNCPLEGTHTHLPCAASCSLQCASHTQ